jgi:FtsZ-binding cell division protein ZapB
MMRQNESLKKDDTLMNLEVAQLKKQTNSLVTENEVLKQENAIFK